MQIDCTFWSRKSTRNFLKVSVDLCAEFVITVCASMSFSPLILVNMKMITTWIVDLALKTQVYILMMISVLLAIYRLVFLRPKKINF